MVSLFIDQWISMKICHVGDGQFSRIGRFFLRGEQDLCEPWQDRLLSCHTHTFTRGSENYGEIYGAPGGLIARASNQLSYRFDLSAVGFHSVSKSVTVSI